MSKKRDGKLLTQEEMEFFVSGFTRGEIPDYQASAFLMASFLKGLTPKETSFLASAMLHSGEILSLASVPGLKVDKHSTGGVGDGISLALAPLAAACGAKVPMISGRALGHTGGTLDKLESIPGFRTDLSQDRFIGQVKDIGVCMIGQTAEIAPADKKIYALRDVTGTVESIPLISASIMSKKLAEGADALVLDVKTGSGAFMREKKDALKLAKSMLDIGRRSRKKMAAVITDMNQPLGAAVGNALEIEQTVRILSGQESPLTRDFVELTEVLGGWMLFLGGVAKTSVEGRERIRKARQDGSGLAKFKEMVRAQGGEPAVCDRPQDILARASIRKTLVSPWKGFVNVLEARSVGIAALLLGAGRRTQESSVDASAGILLHKKAGDPVERGESVAELFTSRQDWVDGAEKTFFSGLKITKVKPRLPRLIHQILRS
ncbi:MAG: thymidine phosphorylase [Elusimicrobia bacterium RIFCSPLOWO2_01_FULL_60_11]|nr:MAG: thymidine phosphorylase [Elusimicrobia bacterium RIFCSPLOWO2_01_FULL_60_11]